MTDKLYEIKNRWTGEVIFSLECGSFRLAIEAAIKSRANLYGANLDGASLVRANLDGANLDGASLDGANLGGANLGGANLDGANLDGANLGGANLYGANLVRANLDGANLDGANLDGASLDGANLDGASLDGANLDGANLDGAKLTDDITINKTPIQLTGLYYFVIIFDEHMRIGCEFHSLADWFSYDDQRIVDMDGKNAMTFWKQCKEPLLQICIADDRYQHELKKPA
ncbi:MAG: pentapeptide repeat-containing protein [Candidatus Thiodiazotropha sp. (ex Troendleina suluensis)]|nr:pentapeptide repeat-containing protein [Candidatus Thiodiazotropha sp. (ex Troendleina suluensis)]